MTRWVNSANDTAAGQQAVAMVTLCDLNFASGTLHLHDGLGQLVYNSNTYSGIGQYGTIDAINEDLTATAKTLQLTLSGVDASLVGSAMTEDYQGKIVTIYIGLLDVNTMAWYANAEVVWEGRMDYMTIDLSQGTGTIKLICESRLFIEPRVARYTDQDQQLAHAGDSFLDLIWLIPLATANWGAVNVTHPATRPPQFPTKGGPGGGGGGGPFRP